MQPSEFSERAEVGDFIIIGELMIQEPVKEALWYRIGYQVITASLVFLVILFGMGYYYKNYTYCEMYNGMPKILIYNGSYTCMPDGIYNEIECHGKWGFFFGRNKTLNFTDNYTVQSFPVKKNGMHSIHYKVFECNSSYEYVGKLTLLNFTRITGDTLFSTNKGSIDADDLWVAIDGSEVV